MIKKLKVLSHCGGTFDIYSRNTIKNDMVSIDSITFENPKVDARRHWQDIMSEGEVIGAICETSTGIHKALDTRYQVITPEENQDKAENWYISEDKGYIFAYFRTLEGLVDFINETAK